MISKLFLVVLLTVVLFSLQASAVSLSSNGEVHTITQGNLEFRTDPSGLVKLFKGGSANENYLGAMGFTLKGTINGQQKFLNSWSTTWTWQVLSNTDSNITVLGSTTWQGLDWKQRWFWGEEEGQQTQKFTNYLTNNTGFDSTNTSFYYVFRIDETNVSCLNYVDNEGKANEYCFEQDITKTQNLNQYLKRINFMGNMFNFQDLTDSGFAFNYLFAGELANVKPTLAGKGFIIGVTKNNGLFPSGASIELDPSIIDSSPLSKTNYGNVIVRDSSDNIFVVHEETISASNTDVFVSKSVDEGATWTSVNITNTTDFNEMFPHIDINSTGGLIIAYDKIIDDPASAEVYITTCSAGGCDASGEFLTDINISACGDGTECSHSMIAVDVNDNSHLVYAQGGGGLVYRTISGFVGGSWGAEETAISGGSVNDRDGTGIVVSTNGSNRKLAFVNTDNAQLRVGYFNSLQWTDLQLELDQVEEPPSGFAGYDGNFYLTYTKDISGPSSVSRVHYRQCQITADCNVLANWSNDLNVSTGENKMFVSIMQTSDLNVHILASALVGTVGTDISIFTRTPDNAFVTSHLADGNTLFSDANRTYNPLLRNRDYNGAVLNRFGLPTANSTTLDYVFLTSANSTGDPSTLLFDSNTYFLANGITASFTTTPASPIVLDPEQGITNVQTDLNSTTEFAGPIVDINFLWQVDSAEISTNENTVWDFNGGDTDFNVSLIVQGNDGIETFTSQNDSNILLRIAPQGVDFNFVNNAFANNVDVNFTVTATGTINYAVWGGTDFDINLLGTTVQKTFDQNKITQVCVIVNGTGDTNKLVCKDYVVARWLVSPAIDEETEASLTPTITTYNRPSQTYSHSVDINVFTFYGEEVNFDTNAAFLIDFNTSYFTRNYFFDLDQNQTFFLLQPRLPVVANSIQSTVFTIDNFTRDTVPEIVIQSIRTIAGVETIVESTISDSTGTATMSFVANLDYTLRFLDADGKILSEGPLGPKSTVLYAFIGTAEINFVLTPVGELVVQWIPSTSSIDANTNFIVRFNQIINQVDLNITTLSVRISQGDTNFFVQDFNFLGADTNIFQDVNVLDANEFSFMVVTITAQTPDGNFTKSFSYILVFTAGGSLVKNIQSLKTELGPTVVLIIALIITLFTIGGFAKVATTDFNWLGLIALFVLGIFTYFTWIPLTIYLVAILMGGAGLVYRWVR